MQGVPASCKMSQGPPLALAEAALAQLDMAERQLDDLDSVRRPSLLVPEVQEPKNDDLKPFLKGWSPHGPNGY